jgi:two-component system alkaline phosphatase synthesis response regulator PhoP
MSKKILIVEDDEVVTEAISYNLEWNGYQVEAAADGVSALKLVQNEPPDLIILDIALPKKNGLDLCREIRHTENTAKLPIIMLTARGSEIDKEVGLDAGADDYVTKPFQRSELLARVRALLRRSAYTPEKKEAEPQSILTAGPVRIDLTGRNAICRDKLLDLTYRQFELLVYLVRNRNVVLTRDQLLEYVWGYDYIGDPRTLDVHIHWLREFIEEDPKSPRFIQTVRGVGYCFR